MISLKILKTQMLFDGRTMKLSLLLISV